MTAIGTTTTSRTIRSYATVVSNALNAGLFVLTGILFGYAVATSGGVMNAIALGETIANSSTLEHNDLGQVFYLGALTSFLFVIPVHAFFHTEAFHSTGDHFVYTTFHSVTVGLLSITISVYGASGGVALLTGVLSALGFYLAFAVIIAVLGLTFDVLSGV